MVQGYELPVIPRHLAAGAAPGAIARSAGAARLAGSPAVLPSTVSKLGTPTGRLQAGLQAEPGVLLSSPGASIRPQTAPRAPLAPRRGDGLRSTCAPRSHPSVSARGWLGVGGGCSRGRSRCCWQACGRAQGRARGGSAHLSAWLVRADPADDSSGDGPWRALWPLLPCLTILLEPQAHIAHLAQSSRP